MDIITKGYLYGIVFPELDQAIRALRADGADVQKERANRDALAATVPSVFGDLLDFVGKNGGHNFMNLPVSRDYYATGLIGYDVGKDPWGIVWYSTPEAAQKVADAFPQFKVLNSAGEAVAPSGQKRPPRGPQP